MRIETLPTGDYILATKKEVQALLRFVVDDAAWPSLCCINVTDRGIEATDGRKLIRWSPADWGAAKVGEGALIRGDALKTAAAAVSGGKQVGIPIEQGDVLVLSNDTLDPVTLGSFGSFPAEEPFPDVERAMPRGNETAAAEVGISPTLFGEAMDSARKLGVELFKMRTHGDHEPIVVEGKCSDDGDVVMVLMPMRI